MTCISYSCLCAHLLYLHNDVSSLEAGPYLLLGQKIPTHLQKQNTPYSLPHEETHKLRITHTTILPDTSLGQKNYKDNKSQSQELELLPESYMEAYIFTHINKCNNYLTSHTPSSGFYQPLFLALLFFLRSQHIFCHTTSICLKKERTKAQIYSKPTTINENCSLSTHRPWVDRFRSEVTFYKGQCLCQRSTPGPLLTECSVLLQRPLISSLFSLLTPFAAAAQTARRQDCMKGVAFISLH